MQTGSQVGTQLVCKRCVICWSIWLCWVHSESRLQYRDGGGNQTANHV